MTSPQGTTRCDGSVITCPKCGSVTVRPVPSHDGQRWFVCKGNCGREFVDRERKAGS